MHCEGPCRCTVSPCVTATSAPHQPLWALPCMEKCRSEKVHGSSIAASLCLKHGSQWRSLFFSSTFLISSTFGSTFFFCFALSKPVAISKHALRGPALAILNEGNEVVHLKHLRLVWDENNKHQTTETGKNKQTKQQTHNFTKKNTESCCFLESRCITNTFHQKKPREKHISVRQSWSWLVEFRPSKPWERQLLDWGLSCYMLKPLLPSRTPSIQIQVGDQMANLWTIRSQG